MVITEVLKRHIIASAIGSADLFISVEIRSVNRMIGAVDMKESSTRHKNANIAGTIMTFVPWLNIAGAKRSLTPNRTMHSTASSTDATAVAATHSMPPDSSFEASILERRCGRMRTVAPCRRCTHSKASYPQE